MKPGNDNVRFAHSAPGRSFDFWETLRTHSVEVGESAAASAGAFGVAEVGRVSGLLHDIGKCSPAFQAYIRSSDAVHRGPNHAYAGALVARERYPGPFGRILSLIIAGHHAGLANGIALDERLGPGRSDVPPFDGWEAEIDPLPDAAAFRGIVPLRLSCERGFTQAFLTRMLFSCLVDADSVATEAFYATLEDRTVPRGGFTGLATLRNRLLAHMASFGSGAAPVDGEAGSLNRLRARVLDHARSKAAETPGLFTLTVPTGGGKTLTSLSFALDHAIAHGMRRVIFVIPFTSIIEQTADVFRRALAAEPSGLNETDILEHHASFDWDAKYSERIPREDGRGDGARERLERAAENWEAPIVVTTAVQFFESLFSNRRTPCRKLHNIAGSVVVLDEAQVLPLHLLRPCMAALDELAQNYRTTVVLCTATQPALRKQDGFEGGLDIPDDRELAPDRQGLFKALKRAEIERRGTVGDEEIAARFAEQPQILCIVNRRAHAQTLFLRIKDLPGAVHLSTLMCPAHRRMVLAGARARLVAGEPVRIVSTSLIEAGVDIDVPEVWRAAAGLDSVLQAAGRCNREGRLPDLGRVVIFEPEDGKAPPDLEQAASVGRTVLQRHPDPQTLEAIRDYFGELYWRRGAEALDAARLDGRPFPILASIAEREKALTFPFEDIARAFRMIDETMESVIVPWRATPDDRTAEKILDRIGAMDRPLAADLRRLQQYTVAIPTSERDLWLGSGALYPVHQALGEALLRFDDDQAHYDPFMGVKVGKHFERSAASNIIG